MIAGPVLGMALAAAFLIYGWGGAKAGAKQVKCIVTTGHKCPKVKQP